MIRPIMHSLLGAKLCRRGRAVVAVSYFRSLISLEQRESFPSFEKGGRIGGPNAPTT
jgi:hypothetical protein